MSWHPHSLRLALDHILWLPEREEEPKDNAPGSEWVRIGTAMSYALSKLLDRVDPQVSTLERGDNKEPVLALPPLQEKRQESFLSMRALAHAIKKSVRHTRRVVAKLEALGVVERELREWQPSRFLVKLQELQALIDWNKEVATVVEEHRRDAWCGKQGAQPTQIPEVVEEPKAPQPPPLLSRLNRAARRAAPGSTPTDLPVCPECPKVGRLAGVRDRPALVAWALQQADANLARYGVPEWASTGPRRPEQAQELARLVLGWIGVQQGEVDGRMLAQLGGIQARSLAVLWRGAGSPQAELLLDLLAKVYWAHQAGAFDVRRGNAVLGYWLSRPKWRNLLRPSAWVETLETAQTAYAAAQQEKAQAATEQELGQHIRELFTELGLAPHGSTQRAQMQQELDGLAQTLAQQGDQAWADLIWTELGRAWGEAWTPDPELGMRLELPDSGADPPS